MYQLIERKPVQGNNEQRAKRMMRSTPSDAVCVAPDARGGRREERCADHDLIGKHIELYNPALPHYRRSHAPNSRYLPCKLTIREMHDDYQAKHPSCLTSYCTYQRIMKKKNISFTKLSTEECELCRSLKLKHIMADDGVNLLKSVNHASSRQNMIRGSWRLD